ncbi:MAG TPA: M23 family metallopeptidase [Bacteroidales bacterium]|nr:M23 family metallopeptidase [Bacteroidales bacterium]
MPKGRKYILDKSNLQFLQHRRKWSEKLIRTAAFFAVSLLLTAAYGFVFERLFGSPKQELLTQRVEEMKLKYNLMERKIDRSSELISDLRITDNASYRAILDLPQIPESIDEGGSGGIDKLGDLAGYINTELMIEVKSKFEDLKTQTNIQYNSLNELTVKVEEWKDMWAHLPYIRPVNVTMPIGDGFKFREHHPVLGTPRWHYGQDFRCPIGTKVYATGAGMVYQADNENDGYGNKMIIDHGYGYRSLYGHLSKFVVKPGQKVKRGDLIAYSGNTGLTSGPHLHYQIDLFGEHVNPLSYFADNLTEEEYFKMLDYLTSPAH